MATVIGAALIALVVWGYWSFYASGQYSAKRPPPDLTGFRPPSDHAAQDKSAAQPPTGDPNIGEGSDPV